MHVCMFIRLWKQPFALSKYEGPYSGVCLFQANMPSWVVLRLGLIGLWVRLSGFVKWQNFIRWIQVLNSLHMIHQAGSGLAMISIYATILDMSCSCLNCKGLSCQYWRLKFVLVNVIFRRCLRSLSICSAFHMLWIFILVTFCFSYWGMATLIVLSLYTLSCCRTSSIQLNSDWICWLNWFGNLGSCVHV